MAEDDYDVAAADHDVDQEDDKSCLTLILLT
jgi:hypothetical protein